MYEPKSRQKLGNIINLLTNLFLKGAVRQFKNVAELHYIIFPIRNIICLCCTSKKSITTQEHNTQEHFNILFKS